MSDAELTRLAQAGDTAALGVLLARHQAGMRAVALGVLGFGPDAEDAVQDAALTALRSIGGLRDPRAAGPWLRMIVRNACRMRLRASATTVPLARPLLEADGVPLLRGTPTPEEVLDRHALRDWIWHAVSELPEPLQLTLMLRHFTGVTSYEHIASVTGVPVGTVRSRLSQARARVASALLATGDAAHADASALTEARHREGVETLAAAERGMFAEVVADRWDDGVELLGGRGERGGRDLLLRAMDRDLTAGVRQRVLRTVAGSSLTIWENELISPPDDPDHCPPAVVWVLSERDGRIQRLRLFHPTPYPRHPVDERPPSAL
ncbi:sigma-70 family RNA polymerase sigma factor [Streptomyces sp. J2-1]|nr:sigma-70 family RNA polymerase sigma factor [Streptomyces corallincola]